jgi:hypothetical protein
MRTELYERPSETGDPLRSARSKTDLKGLASRDEHHDLHSKSVELVSSCRKLACAGRICRSDEIADGQKIS